MIRCVRIWTAIDGNSEFEEGTIDLWKGERGDVLSGNVAASSISFRETKSGGTFAPHDAPTRQFVLTLSGSLEFKTAKRETLHLSRAFRGPKVNMPVATSASPFMRCSAASDCVSAMHFLVLLGWLKNVKVTPERWPIGSYPICPPGCSYF